MFKVTNYGKDVVLKVLFITLAIDAAAFIVNIAWLKLLLFSISLFLLVITLYFFRDPERKLPAGITPDTVISPADGKVVLIEKVKNGYPEFFSGEELTQVSIFLSPLNVHVNCYPVSGTLKYFNYIKGDYVVAFDNKSSDRNERSEIGIETKKGRKIIFKQIAGFVARRIVCDLRLNSNVKAGEKFGMIKFGSRVDILVPTDTEIKVKLKDKVTAGVTEIAKLR
ncbi:MAG TPA: phosphatidylserine decarboxylase family protein [Ignavibacteria bacterium]|nr:phosphatidylserine decarboxylase family protein [Ignavibacteria bacterium]